MTYPPDPPAGQLPSTLSIDEANKFALKFIVEWIEAGGGDSMEKTAVSYPKTRPGMQVILALAEALQIQELVARIKSDLDKEASRPKRCPECKRFE